MRTLEQILAAQDAEFAAMPAEQKPTSQSDVGVLATFRRAFALLTQSVEQRAETLITEVETLASANRYGSLAWYVAQIKAFQFGDVLGVMDGVTVGYGTVDPTKQIVKQCAVLEDNGRLLVKVARQSGAGLGSLNAEQLTALRSYVQAVKLAGVRVDIISLAADELRLTAIVQYDRQVLGPTGALLQDANKFPVRDALNAYLQRLPFDSVLNWNEMIDALRAVAGVVDVQITYTSLRPGGATTWTDFSRETTTQAGYVVIHPDTSIVYV